MHRFSVFPLLLVACTSSSTGRGGACRDENLTPTRLANALAMMDAMCLRDVHERREFPVQDYACVDMGDALATGRCGIPRDVARARRYFETACARGYQPACDALKGAL